VLTVNFEDIDSFVSIGAEDYVCILTRGHAWDTAIQAQVLRKAPCYVGVIGSRKKAAAVRETLRTQYGLSEGELDRVTTPIGLEIGAQTPAEIAVSIAAQMIQVRSGRSQ
jgi:xanthine dehydrogenase accessory factor